MQSTTKSPFLPSTLFWDDRRDDLRPGIRSIPVGEYVIFYRRDGEDVLVLHVLHGRRDIGSIL